VDGWAILWVILGALVGVAACVTLLYVFVFKELADEEVENG
jgi:hypothetical protein